MTDKVVHAFPVSELPENLMQIEPRNPALPFYCNHDAITVDPHDRTVICARCTATLDPFQFLLNNATTIQMAWRNHAEANRKVADLNNSIQILLKEEKRLKSAVRRLKEKTGVIDVRGKETI